MKTIKISTPASRYCDLEESKVLERIVEKREIKAAHLYRLRKRQKHPYLTFEFYQTWKK